MMTIQETLRNAVVNRLKEISTANGYLTNPLDARAEFAAISMADFQGGTLIVVELAGDDLQEHALTRYAGTFELQVVILTDQSPMDSTLIRALADVRRALLRTDLHEAATETRLNGRASYGLDETGAFAFVDQPIAIQYQDDLS